MKNHQYSNHETQSDIVICLFKIYYYYLLIGPTFLVIKVKKIAAEVMTQSQCKMGKLFNLVWLLEYGLFILRYRPMFCSVFSQ